MNVKNVIAIFIISILFLFVSCDGSSSSTSSSSYTKNESSRSIDSDSYDSISYETFSTSVTLDLSTPSIDSEEITTSGVELSSGITAKLAKSSKPAYLTVDTSGYDGNVELNISGTLSNYGLKIDGNASYCVTLNLSDVTIESANTPCIKVSDITKSYIVFDGTNTLTDGRSYGTGYSKAEGTDYYTSSYDGDIEDGAEETQTWALGDDAKGTIFSKFPLIFSGDGTLSVTQNYKHAIYSKDYIKVNSGTINTASTGGRNGFQSVNGFIMNGGKITINGSGTNIDNESRGIVVEGSDENSSYAGEGYILINDGTLTINTYSKGITAKWDIDEDYTTSSTDDDPYPAVLINGGTITVTTTGTVKDDYSASVTDANGVTSTETVSCSPEGIEGKQAIY
nr:carbohydrate-binding domain-containing protein [Sphaerochaetaceae bacterium]